LFNPVRMKKFYLVVAKRYETQVLEEIASLNAAQLIDARDVMAGEAEGSETYDRFLRMVQRCSSLLGSISSLKARFPDEFPVGEGKTTVSERPRRSMRVTQSELRRTLAKYESRLDELNRDVDRLLNDVEGMGAMSRSLSLLRTLQVGTDALGPHVFTVVKAGVVGAQSIPKLEESLSSLGAVHEVTRVDPGEALVAIVAPKQSKQKLDDLLTRYGFQGIDLPEGLDPDPEKAITGVEAAMKKRMGDAASLERSVSEVADELDTRADYVGFLKEATTVLSRTKDLSAIQGWIIETSIEPMRQKVAATTSNAYYLKIDNPRRGEQTPVLLAKRGWLLKGFELLTSVRGTPSYNEMDPTIIFALFFPIMYGIMFGDVGDGAVILCLGLLLLRAKRGFIGLSRHALNSIGTIMIVGGFSAIVFGFFYGSVFLSSALFHPLLFEPVSAFGTIVLLALAFGVLQLAVSLTLNIRNLVARGELKEAVLSGKGVVGLVYYLLGIVLAARLILGGLQLSLFVSPENLPLTAGALACLLLVFLSPLLRGLGTEELKLGEAVIEGFGEFIEVFISFITNSLSYLRLAAFAIAHGIFAGFAADLGGSIGIIASLVLVNALVIIVDGFAAGIQSIRLLYYEFSTKFFAGAGQRFKPLTLKLTENSPAA
jgi:vacuolar-type H+-ATPase subunit I/STV1